MSFGPPPSVFTQSTVAADRARRQRRRRRALGAGAVVLVLALCTGGWLLWLGPDDAADTAHQDGKPSAGTASQGRLDIRETVEKRPESTTGQMAFRFAVDDMSPGEEYEMPGTWATDKVLAKGINRTLVGFEVGKDVTTDDEIWRIPLSGPICGVTRHVTVEGRTAVLHRAQKNPESLCNQVAFVDIDSGKKLWDKEFPTSESVFGQDATSVTMTRGTVAVAWGDGATAYDMDRGTRLWRNKKSDGCTYQGLAGGRALLTLLACSRGKEDITYRVRNLAPRTGTTRWTHQAAGGVKDVKVLSTDPPVIAVGAGDLDLTHLFSLDDRGKRRATIGLDGGRYEVRCRERHDYPAIDDCPSTVVSDDQVFLTSREAEGANWMTSFDLSTGKAVRKFDAGRNQLLYPLRMSGGQVLAFRESSDHITPLGVVSLNPRTGKETPYFSFGLPPEAWTLTSLELSDVVVQNGRIFFGDFRAEGPVDNAKDTPKVSWLVLGIEGARKAPN
ncbi:PQQ-binding-like beta-propeller repeat protein [Streptomyces sp. NPDC020607]|uniref:outer membrane protein assembly factor BamB family protein n=1 Tax=Streptomyces sp. NPDC020607 TaxID=3365082 RepID=UPI0037A947C4